MSAADPFSPSVILSGDEGTARFAAVLAAHLRAGDTLLLEGPVGAGKTAFSRALIQHLLREDGLPVEDVPSPTFTLVQTYAAQRFDIWHADLYRLTQPEEVLELGLAEAFDTALCLIEWPDRLGRDLPETAAVLRFAMEGAEARSITLAGGALSDRLAPAFAPPPPGATP